MSGNGPYLSVVVPAHDAETILPETLGALLESDYPRSEWELIVVDDASTDRTPEVAREYADRVVEIGGSPRGPAYARNRGVQVCRGECVAFVDADCRVHRDTLRKLATTLREEERWSAVFGSYDADPPGPGVVSRFRNLMHHWVHQQNAGEAETFWAGCGAVRREVFESVGKYDEWHYSEPKIEDIEFGRRLRLHGHRILLHPDIQVTHLKEWTLKGMIETDFRHRGLAWTRLLVQEGASAPTRALNLRTTQKVCTAASPAALVAGAAGVATGTEWFLAVAAVMVFLIGAFNIRFYKRLARTQGWWFPLVAVPLHLLHYGTAAVAGVVGWVVHHLVGAPMPSPEVVAFREAGLESASSQPSPPTKSLWLKGSLPAGSAGGRGGTWAARAGTGPRSGGSRSDADDFRGRFQLAFLPLHKRALGVGVGTAAGLVVFLVTVVYLLRGPAPGIELELLSEYFYGYEVSVRGAVIGALWLWFVGFVGGWFLAFCRNLVLAMSKPVNRSLPSSETAEFLDHL